MCSKIADHVEDTRGVQRLPLRHTWPIKYCLSLSISKHVFLMRYSFVRLSIMGLLMLRLLPNSGS